MKITLSVWRLFQPPGMNHRHSVLTTTAEERSDYTVTHSRLGTKTWRIMRIMAILFTACCIQVSAKTLSQTVTFSGENVTIEKVLQEVQRQTNYFIIYDADLLKNTKVVSLNVQNEPLQRFMNRLVKDQPITYSFQNTTIVIERKLSVPTFQPATIRPDLSAEIPPIKISGTIIGPNNQPLAGATVRLKGKNTSTVANESGFFELTAELGNILVVSYIGFQQKEFKINSPEKLTIELVRLQANLDTTEITISTGFQRLPKERATGSFEFINNDLLNRRVSSDILSRIDGVASGVLFNRNSNTPNDINIRGRSTILSNDQPLIVIDNFPFEGNLNNINPNDIDNITILKDAAAASIWGVRAGNGVIVITTKRAKLNQPLLVEINSNVTLTEKPDLHYRPTISSSDFIDLEQKLYAQGYYNSDINSTNRVPLSPVVELLEKRRNESISQAEFESELNMLRNHDVRSDYEKYLYRSGLQQQYSLNLRAGNHNTQHYLSIGYDDNRPNLVKNRAERITLKAISTYLPVKNLEITGGVNYIRNNSILNNPGSDLRTSSAKVLYPYAILADANGTPLTIVKDYSRGYIDTAGGGSLLDWGYSPLSEIELANNKTAQDEFRLTGKMKYNFNSALNVEGSYQYQKLLTSGRNLQSVNTYYARDLINQFTYRNPDGTLTRNIPPGGILDQSNETLTSAATRIQLNYSEKVGSHGISALAGFENRRVKTKGGYSRLYGYDDDRLTNSSILDYTKFYSLYYNNFLSAQIPFVNGLYNETSDLFTSYYGNISYTFNSRYIFSGSGRIDQSNYFGVKANQRRVPLWSAGFSWIASSENFYNVHVLPNLKVRVTYGYNGNINKNVSALTTISLLSGAFTTGLPYANLRNPPNDQLRWERVKVANFGIDFGFRNNIISGSIEYYSKGGIDLIGDAPIDATIGISTFRGNIANSKGQGLDIVLNSINISGTNFKWTSNLLASYAVDKVTKYVNKSSTGNYTIFGNGYSANNNIIYPYEGRPVFSLYSYRSAGLDSTGNPRGYLPDGKVSSDASKVITGTKPEHLIYHGPARPTFFGSLRNNISFKSISFSANIIFKAGHYFRRPSISYASLINGWSGHSDYSLRWQQKGDEAKTNVPGVPSIVNTNRDNLYLYSDIMVEKGDHIRLQDIQITYDLTPKLLNKLSLKNLQVYCYMNNIGIIWKNTKYDIDPDYVVGIPNPRTYSFGLRATL